jgi:hypothetical protein
MKNEYQLKRLNLNSKTSSVLINLLETKNFTNNKIVK